MDLIANYDSDSKEEQEVIKAKSRKSYSAEFKLKVVNFAKSVGGSNHSTSKKFGVDRSTVIDWIRQDCFIVFTFDYRNSSTAGKSKKRLQGGGRKLTYKDLDEQLALWVREMRSKKLRVSRDSIQRQAEKTFNAEKDDGVFKASKGWLERFLSRNNFRLRVPTTVCQKTPADYVQKIVNFLLYISEIRQKNNYREIFAADETAIYLDPSEGKCIDEVGAKEISVLSTGHDKQRVTVILTARSDGKKCKPFVLMDRKKGKDVTAAQEKYKAKLELCWKGTVWMNDELTLDYLDRVFGHYLFGGKRLLVWDSFRCHLVNRRNKENVDLKKKLREFNLHTAVVPGGCTKFIQAPDVSWNGPFKAHFRKSYDRWISNDAQKEFTSGGNPKAPAMDVYLQWIVEAWDSLPAEAIAKSFKDCGITICPDGSEDDHVHCFKKHGPIPSGKFELLVARNALRQAGAVVEEADAQEDEENGYVSDESLELDWTDELNAPNPEFHAF